MTTMLSITRTAARTLAPRVASPALANVARRGYHENIVEHYENPRNVGSFAKDEEGVGTVRLTETVRKLLNR